MSLDLLLAVAGIAVTALVIAGMILLTPRGAVRVEAADADSNLSAARAGDPSPPVPTAV